MTDSQTSAPTQKKAFWWNVIASVVASVIFLAFIQPFLTLFWELLTSTGSAALNLLVDRFYMNAALGHRNWVVAMIAVACILVPVIVACTATFQIFTRRPAHQVESSGRLRSALSRAASRKFTLLVILVPSVASGLWMSTSIFTDLQLNASFNQRLAVLAPHVSEQQVKVLRAGWASMVSKADHKAIQAQIETLAAQASVKLPAQLLSD